MSLFLKWWLLFLLSLAGTMTSIYFNFDTFIYENDFTKLTYVIIGITIMTTVMIGYKIYSSYVKDNNLYHYETEWFLSEVVISIGMIGTVIGFIYMLYSVFNNLNIEDTFAIQQSLGHMAKGMGTALLTTLIGLISSVLIKSQLILVENEEI